MLTKHITVHSLSVVQCLITILRTFQINYPLFVKILYLFVCFFIAARTVLWVDTSLKTPSPAITITNEEVRWLKDCSKIKLCSITLLVLYLTKVALHSSLLTLGSSSSESSYTLPHLSLQSGFSFNWLPLENLSLEQQMGGDVSAIAECFRWLFKEYRLFLTSYRVKCKQKMVQLSI